MSKKSDSPTQLDSLIDGLERLVLEDEAPESLSPAERTELQRTMRGIVVRSAARASIETAPTTSLRRSNLKKSAAVRLGELKLLLGNLGVAPPQLSAVFGDDDDLGEEKLRALLEDVERATSGKAKR